MVDIFELRLAKERLKAKDSVIEGLGAFARTGFRKGDLICVFQGETISVPELKRRYESGTERISDPLQVSERRYLDMNEPFVHINHSCSPNTAVIGKASLVALRPIDKDEEVTYDYSLTEWTWEKFGKNAEWSMQCACNTQECRGKVTQFPFMPTALKTQHWRNGTLPDHIIRKVVKAGLEYKSQKQYQ